MYYRARYYAQSLGRFISADTIVLGTENPQNRNRYAYGLNNPLNHTDPSGYFSPEELQKLLGFEDDLEAFKKYFDSLSQWWQRTLRDADFLDNIIVDGKAYSFVYGAAIQRPTFDKPEHAQWCDKITLALWDISESHSEHFVDFLSFTGGKDLQHIPWGTRRQNWVDPRSSFRGKDESVAFDDEIKEDMNNSAWQLLQLANFFAPETETFVRVASKAIDAVDIAKGFSELGVNISLQAPTPYLHRRPSKEEDLWNGYVRSRLKSPW
jgi:hypothetical protein